MNTGWICPKCERVFGPSVRECETCNLQVEIGEPKPPQPTDTITLPPNGATVPPVIWGTFTSSDLKANGSTGTCFSLFNLSKGEQ